MIQQFCDITAHNFILNKKYPTPDDSFESAVNIEIGLPVPQYQTSAFWGVMMEWLVLLQQKELYQTLQPFLKEDLAEVTKCILFLRSDEELAFYDSIAMNKAGEGVALSPEHTFEELENTMNFIWSQYLGMVAASTQTSPTMHIPMFLVYLPVPVGSALMIFHGVYLMVCHLTGNPTPKIQAELEKEAEQS
jgi:hypothetical protein